MCVAVETCHALPLSFSIDEEWHRVQQAHRRHCIIALLQHVQEQPSDLLGMTLCRASEQGGTRVHTEHIMCQGTWQGWAAGSPGPVYNVRVQ